MNHPEPHLQGLRVAAFESRRAGEVERLIQRFGGQAFVSPSVREVPLDGNEQAVAFVHRLLVGEVSVVIFLTGVGFEQLLAIAQRQVDRQRYLDSLSDIVTIARGPKPGFAMREAALTPTFTVEAPHTWREVLTTIDQHVRVDNLLVAVQEYGETNTSLIAGLEARGAQVLAVPVYRWELPLDVEPLRENVRRLAAGELDVVLFTSAIQVTNLLEVSAQLGLREDVLRSFRRIVVASIGPTTSSMLRQHSLPVDLEPELSRLGHFARQVALRAPELCARKVQMAARLGHPSLPVDERSAPWFNSPFLRACRGEPTDVTPIWMMRQAGRYMAEYRQVRDKVSFLELCKDPALCSEVMCTAVKRLGVDAAIIFSDLLPILEPMGLDLEFSPGGGPVIHNPVREPADVDRVVELDSVDALHFVMETVRQTRRDLPAHIPLIGFAGAPFTLASYTMEGGSSRNFLHTKTLMYRDPGAWRALMQRLSRAVTLYLNAQIAAGAQAVQLFDSWVGCLGVDDYRAFVLPYVQEIVAHITPGVPVINFATGNPMLNPLLAESQSAVVGVDWRMPLDVAWEMVGTGRAIQGNLDPSLLLADKALLRNRVEALLRLAGGRPGHIFNLGHGILPQTPVDHAIALVDMVHELSRR